MLPNMKMASIYKKAGEGYRWKRRKSYAAAEGEAYALTTIPKKRLRWVMEIFEKPLKEPG